MTEMELEEIVKQAVGEEMSKCPGAVLFSSFASIKPARFYIMGLNPGGSSKEVKSSIFSTLAPKDGTSPYTHECWKNDCGNGGECKHVTGERLACADLVKHQKNVIHLSGLLGYQSPADVPSANAIFARSRSFATLEDETGCAREAWWQRCWPVHQHLLEVVRPEIIITLGYGLRTSALGFLAQKMRHSGEPAKIGDESRRGGKMIEGTLSLCGSSLNVRVIGVPHPSYHAVGEKLEDCLRTLVR